MGPGVGSASSRACPQLSRQSLTQAYGAKVDLPRGAIFLERGNLEAGKALLKRVAPVFARLDAEAAANLELDGQSLAASAE